MTTCILVGDCREVVAKLEPDCIDAVVTDPPYHFGSIIKRFSQPDAAPAKSGAYARHATGFMGKAWDAGDISFRPETWAAFLRVMKPGAHLAAFGGTKSFHRMAVAIEDAGFEMRETCAWVFGSGFPKSHKQSGEWEGWGTALKPAFEPIIIVRKPMIGTVAENLAAYGTGAINIEDCRVPNADGAGLGRWPANVMHDGSDEVMGLFPNTTSGRLQTHHKRSGHSRIGTFKIRDRTGEPSDYGGDFGSAARFFYCAKTSRSDRNDGVEDLPEKPLLWSSGTKNPGSFQAEGTNKASQNNHPTVKPTSLMQWLCRLITPPGGTILDPFMGSGSTGRAAALEGFDFIGIEQDAGYAEIAKLRIAASEKLAAALQNPVPLQPDMFVESAENR